MYASWDIRWDSQSFLSFWVIFIPLTLPITQNIEILKKWKKHGDIIIFHLCTSNDNQMFYGSWDIRHDRQTFLSFWDIFRPFTPLIIQKISFEKMKKKTKNKKQKTKNAGRYYHFTLVYHNWQSYDVCFLRYGMWQA